MVMHRGATAVAALTGVAGIAAIGRLHLGASAAAGSPGAAAASDTASGCASSSRARPGAASAAFTLRSAARCASAKFKPPRHLSELVPKNCGEDAFFLAAPTGSTAAVGIADGVGGWANCGVDSALFAWDLMHKCQDIAERGGEASSSTAAPPSDPTPPSEAEDAVSAARPLCPKLLLAEGFNRMKRREGGAHAGSSTACVASLDRLSGDLRIANLGDSGALLVRARSGDCVLESKAQVHRFNCPYQLCCHGGGDAPGRADIYTTRAEPGDLLVLATDGFLDNVSAEMATRTAAALLDKEPGVIADSLLALAQAKAESMDDTPFALEARRHGYRHNGGKPDDITVVVARVEPAS